MTLLPAHYYLLVWTLSLNEIYKLFQENLKSIRDLQAVSKKWNSIQLMKIILNEKDLHN